MTSGDNPNQWHELFDMGINEMASKDKTQRMREAMQKLAPKSILVFKINITSKSTDSEANNVIADELRGRIAQAVQNVIDDANLNSVDRPLTANIVSA